MLHIDVPDVSGGPPVPGAMQWAEAVDRPCAQFAVTSEPDDSAIVMYTGGTPGNPKGVHHIQSRAALNILAHVVCGDIRPDEVMLLSTPLPHSAGFHLQSCFVQGGFVVLGPKFDAKRFLELASELRATWTFAVPTMLYRLLDAMAAGMSPPQSVANGRVRCRADGSRAD